MENAKIIKCKVQVNSWRCVYTTSFLIATCSFRFTWLGPLLTMTSLRSYNVFKNVVPSRLKVISYSEKIFGVKWNNHWIESLRFDVYGYHVNICDVFRLRNWTKTIQLFIQSEREWHFLNKRAFLNEFSDMFYFILSFVLFHLNLFNQNFFK